MLLRTCLCFVRLCACVVVAVLLNRSSTSVMGQEGEKDADAFDPCESGEHTVIDDYKREVDYRTPKGEDHLCDAYLETAWYRFTINGTNSFMPTSCVEPNSCGTQAAVWLTLKDGPPTIGEEKITRACSSWGSPGQETNCCFFPYRVIVRNCGEFLIYRLGSTQACNIAYCVEREKIECEDGLLYDTVLKQCVAVTAPVLDTAVCPQGELFNEDTGECDLIIVEIDQPFITTSVDEEGGAYVNCTFKPPAASPRVSFITTWYEADQSGSLQPILLGPSLKLGADVFAGSTVMCGVKASTAEEGPDDNTEVLSDPYFLGIKAREANLKLREDGRSVNLTLYSTIPLYCDPGTPAAECVLAVNLLAFGTDGEMNERLRFSTCFVEFSAADCLGAVCSEHVVQVTLYPNIEYEDSAPNEIVTLIGALDDYGRGLWRQEIVDIKLELEELPVAQCHVFSDPHIITFDGKPYDLYSRGTFVLHKSNARDFTIHLRVSDCGNNEGYCACGYVARDAGDVVSVDMCSGQLPPGQADVNFPGNFISDDVKIYKSKGGKLLTVVFASGTMVKTFLEPWGMSLSLLAPATDVGFSRGLCGFYDFDMDNEFHDDQGKAVKAVSDRLTELEFVQTWRLPPASSFFDNPPINDPQPLGVPSRCDCSASNTGGVCPLTSLVDGIIPSVIPAIDETDFFFGQSRYLGDPDGVPQTVDPDDQYPDYYGAPDLPEDFDSSEASPPPPPPTRAKRQAESTPASHQEPAKDFVQPRNASSSYFFQPDYLLASTAFIPRWPTTSGLTESEAADICADRLFGSDIALNCAEYLGSALGTAFEFCKSDVQVKSNKSWADYTVPLLESLCDLSLLQSARDFREPGARVADWPKVLEDAIACPKGCKNGECGPEGCICEPGFRGPDCEKAEDDDLEESTESPIVPVTIPPTTTTSTARPDTTSSTVSAKPSSTTTTSTTPYTTSTSTTTISTEKTTTVIALEYTIATSRTPSPSSTTPPTPPTTGISTTARRPTSPQPVVEDLLSTPGAENELDGGSGENTEVVRKFSFVLCDLRRESCTDVNFGVTSQDHFLRCRVTAVEVGDGEVAPLSSTTPIPAGSNILPDGRFICVLPALDYLRQIFNTRRPLDSVRVEAVVDAGGVADRTEPVVATIIYTIYDSVCRSCGVDGRFGCVTKEDACYIEGKCYTVFQPHPFDTCLQCRPEFTNEQWSTRANNIAPVISFNERPVVFIGQDVRLRIRVNDPDGSRFFLSVDRKDAFISQSGLFQWRATANGMQEVSVGTEEFILIARDECNATATSRLEIVTVPCECQNAGTCVNPVVIGQQYTYNCYCASGYTGSRCEVEIDECANSPCARGVCVDLINTFECVCDPGFEGELCDIASDQCQKEPCYPGVLCQPLAGSFICGPCPAGLTGDGTICVEIDSCQDNPCFTGADCVDLKPPNDGFECGTCPRFFGGNGRQCVRSGESACKQKVCSDRVSCAELTSYPGYQCGPCPPGYSGNGSTCEPICEEKCAPGRVCVEPGVCGCPPGYVGDHCNIPECNPSCRNGGVCYAPNFCRCFSGYTGPQCQETSCTPSCLNGGRCIGRNRCVCPYGFRGNRCELQACQRPCQNGGQCVGPNRCQCPRGYQGQYCQRATCYPPCLNGGTCLQPGRCACAPGYDGPNCERALCYPPCERGGVCKRFNTCKCLPGYVGHRCQTAVCRPSCRNGGKCVAPNTCSCPSGWTGHCCYQPECHLPCRNGGICFKPDICACRPGYSGADCRIPLCWPSCDNGGWCLAPDVCHCRSGFYGPRCKKGKYPKRRHF